MHCYRCGWTMPWTCCDGVLFATGFKLHNQKKPRKHNHWPAPSYYSIYTKRLIPFRRASVGLDLGSSCIDRRHATKTYAYSTAKMDCCATPIVGIVRSNKSSCDWIAHSHRQPRYGGDGYLISNTGDISWLSLKFFCSGKRPRLKWLRKSLKPP